MDRSPADITSRKRTRGESWDGRASESSWTPLDTDSDGQARHKDNYSNGQSSKRRKSNMGRGVDLVYNTASTVLHTAAEAVVFCTVLGMAAYKMWYGEDAETVPTTSSDASTRSQRRLTESPDLQQDCPPPYESVYLTSEPKATLSPRRISRSSRIPHTVQSSRRRRAFVPSSARTPSQQPSTSVPSSSTFSMPSSASCSHLSSADVPQSLDTALRDDAADEEDDLFSSMSSRLQSMIQQGNDALNSSFGTPADGISSKDRRKTMPPQLGSSFIPSPVQEAEGRRLGHRSRASLG